MCLLNVVHLEVTPVDIEVFFFPPCFSLVLSHTIYLMALHLLVSSKLPPQLCFFQTLDISPEDIQIPQSISALRRTFLEGGATEGSASMTEWERRLAASPLRRLDDLPMIEPLEDNEVTTKKKCFVKWCSSKLVLFHVDTGL